MWIINSISTSTTLINTESKGIIKMFIRVYIKECWSSLTWSIVKRYTLYTSFGISYVIGQRLKIYLALNNPKSIFFNKSKHYFIL